MSELQIINYSSPYLPLSDEFNRFIKTAALIGIKDERSRLDELGWTGRREQFIQEKFTCQAIPDRKVSFTQLIELSVARVARR